MRAAWPTRCSFAVALLLGLLGPVLAARAHGAPHDLNAAHGRSDLLRSSGLVTSTAALFLPALNPDPNTPSPRPSLELAVPGDHATVAAALAAARPGDVVSVAAGTFEADGLRVPDGVALRGAGWRATTLWRPAPAAPDDAQPGDDLAALPYVVALGAGASVAGMTIGADEAVAVGVRVDSTGAHSVRDVMLRQHAVGVGAWCAPACAARVVVERATCLHCEVGLRSESSAAMAADHVTLREVGTGAAFRGWADALTNSVVDGAEVGVLGAGEAAAATAHHNLYGDVGTPYSGGMMPGAGDLLADALLAPMEHWPTALSPARGAADDGSDLGAIPFAGFGDPPANLRVEPGEPPAEGGPAPWVLAFDVVDDAWIYHAYVTPSEGGGPTSLAYAYADPTVPDGGPRVVLDGLVAGTTYELTASTAYLERGESEAAEPIAFAVPPLATSLEDDDPALTATGAWQPVGAAGASGGRYLASSTEGDTLSFDFAGDSVALLRALGPDGGQANVQIDGRSQGVLEFYFPEARLAVPAVYDGLGDGPHTLVLRVLPSAQQASRGRRVTFDRADAPSGHEPDAIQRAAAGRVNAIRAQAGLGPVRQAGALDLASAAHAWWDMANGFAQGHVERPGTPGFVGARSWDRAAYFGYTPDVGEDMAFEWGTRYTPEDAHYGPAAVDGWQATVYHRNLIMDYSHVDMGFGYSFADDKAVGVLLMGARGGGGRLPTSRFAYTWPVDGQTGVPRGWDGNEGPDPLPQRDDEVGYPVSLYLAQPPQPVAATADRRPLDPAVALWRGARPAGTEGAAVGTRGGLDLARPARPDQSSPWRVTRAELRDAAGAVVRAYAIDQRNDAPKFLGPDVVFLIAERPMAARTRHEARVSGTDSRGAAFDVTWGFTTGE